ncbi:hypothetical protein SAMN04515619_11859 [Collimonas sp. OK412]|jgi:Ni,Fe-hydrogenase III large subunit|nr:hypothetical protein SAMN04515619_11859 [Collimonas sp. OK412]
MEAISKAVFLQEAIVKRKKTQRQSFDGGDGGGYDENMETRVLKLEECVNDARDRLARIETRLDQTATSADMHREMTDQTWRLVTFVCGFGSALVAVTYFMATHIR